MYWGKKCFMDVCIRCTKTHKVMQNSIIFFYTCEPENMKPSKRKTFASLKNTPPEITADDSRAISDPKPNIWETKKPNLKMETCQVNV